MNRGRLKPHVKLWCIFLSAKLCILLRELLRNRSVQTQCRRTSFIRCHSFSVLVHDTSQLHWIAGIWNEILCPNEDKTYLLLARNEFYKRHLTKGLYLGFPIQSTWQLRKAIGMTFCKRSQEILIDHNGCCVFLRCLVKIPPRTFGILT